MTVADFNVNATNNEEWLTPPWILKGLGSFFLDPCSPLPRPWNTAAHHLDKGIDGLEQQWFGRIWLNPPYGREIHKWLDRLVYHGDGIALVFARTDTKWFHDYVWLKADAIFFFRGRLFFHDVKGVRAKNSCGAPSCLVAYGHNNAIALRESGFDGHFQWNG